MLEFNAADFYEVTRSMQHTLTYIEATRAKSIEEHPEGGATIRPIQSDSFISMMRERNTDLRRSLEVLGARVTIMAVDELDASISGMYPTYEALTEGYKDISKTLRRELTQAKLLTLNSEEQAWFAPSSPLFGSGFDAKFRTQGAFELDEAAKCLSLGRPTAAVFHLMRIMEIGIRAMAAHLGLPDPVKPAERNWTLILDAIMGKGIKVKWPTASERMKPECLEMERLHASLDAVKNPFRNSTMHVESKFTDSEAQHIFALVKGFMMRLADRMDEDGEPKVP